MSSRTPPPPIRPSRPVALRLRPALAATLAVVLLAPALPGATAQPAGIEPAWRINTPSSQPERPFEAFDAVTMAAVDLDHDGVKELLVHNDNNHFYVFDGASDKMIAELETNHPDPWHARVLAGPAVGDLTGNGLYDIVLTNSAGRVTVYESQPTGGTPKLEFEKVWERHMDPHKEDPDYADNMIYGSWHGHPGLDGPVALGDVNQNGRDQLFLQLDDMPGLYKLSAGGNVGWWDHISDGNSGPIIADLSGDGRLEVAYPSDGGRILIYDAHTMQHRCTFHAQQHGAWPASISVAPTVADLNGNGRQELVFGVRNVAEDRSAPGWIDRSHAHLFAVNVNCNVLWQQSFPWGNPHVHMSPMVADITGNGLLDVIFQDWNTIGHKPGNWEHTGPANLFAVNGQTGGLLWRVETNTYWSNKNLALADLTGNGQSELLVNEDRGGRDGIGLYSLSGEQGGFIPIASPWSVTRGPLVTDLNGNGRLDIVVPMHRGSNHCEVQKDVGCRAGALQVFRTASSATPDNDNIHILNANLGDTTDITFSPHGNEWWVQTGVFTDRGVSGVHMRIDGGAWKWLEPKDWGAWARSVHAPEGSIIQFRVSASDGAAALSDCYRWTGAHPTPCPDDGTPPPMETRFDHQGGNEWWVEVDVLPQPGAVQARAESSGWRDLALRDWGHWAGSFHIPTGDMVRFQARGADGTWEKSCWFTHPAGAERCDAAPGSFEASFSRPSGNEWWLQITVAANEDLAGVDARIDGGDWRTLKLQDWGDWAASHHAPDGSTVVFRATSESGGTATSEPFSWTP